MKNYDKINNFHRKTMIKNFDKVIPKDKWPEEWKKNEHKGYIRLPQIILSRQVAKIDIPIVKTLENRLSVRDFCDSSMTESQLSTLLYYSVGQKPNTTNRYYPSAGARYPLETYIVVTSNMSPEIKIGLYHYHVKTHSLELLWADKRAKEEMLASIDQEWAKKSQVFVINTAVFSRTAKKYGVRSYRHILCETGYVGQNFYLVSTTLGLGCCAIGGYIDKKLNQLLDIDGTEESVIALYAIGTPNYSNSGMDSTSFS